MGILRRKRHATLSRTGVRHRSLTEQPDVYFHGYLRFKTGDKYKLCLALLLPGHLTLRDRTHLDRVEATIPLNGGVRFYDGPPSINRHLLKSNTKKQLVKFEIHTAPAAITLSHGQAPEEEETFNRKYEFKCNSVDVRDLWKAYIVAICSGKKPDEAGVKLLPGQSMQIERIIDMEERRKHQRSLNASPRLLSAANSETTGVRSLVQQRTPLQKSKSAFVLSSKDNVKRHKFYKDGKKEMPRYFFEDISRETSEAILTMGWQFGNLLMRKSTSFPNSYALSFRSTLNKNSEIFHYEVGPMKKNNTLETYFEIKMEGKHPRFKCLNDVVKYFVRLTDGMAKCITTNDLETLGIKQPPYAVHYEPPTDYDDPTTRPSQPLPPIPAPSSIAETKPSETEDDPDSEEITILLEETSEKTPITKPKVLQTISESNTTIPPPQGPTLRPNPSQHQKVVQISSFADSALQRRDSVVPPPKAPPSGSHLSNQENLPIKTAKHVGFAAPPPPPPPTLNVPMQKRVQHEKLGKVLPKVNQPDRRQFAPEKNLFRLALECEQVSTKAEADPELTPIDVAVQLKGHVKERVASLETDSEKPVPNFLRPAKKDFMGELAEKLKVRRQVVEQTCW